MVCRGGERVWGCLAAKSCPSHIVPDCAREQHGLLADHGDDRSKPTQAEGAQVDAWRGEGGGEGEVVGGMMRPDTEPTHHPMQCAPHPPSRYTAPLSGS